MEIGSIVPNAINLGTQPVKAAKPLAYAYYDPRDTNKDGFVSAAEKQAYELKHPQTANQARSKTTHNGSVEKNNPPTSNTYDANGKTNTLSQASVGKVNLYA